ncbi:MAG: beta-propeller fold lactonase family protein, partial [Planctomycetota bacterium]
LNISFDPIGHFAYVVNQQSDNISVFRVNPQTGNLAPMETLRTRSQPSGLVMIQGEAPAQRRATHLYVTSGGSDDVTTFSLSTTNGAAIQSGVPPLAGDHPSDVAVDPFGRFAFVCNRDSDDLTCYEVSTTNGQLQQLGPTVACGDQPSAVAIDPSGRFVYVTNRGDQTISSFRLERGTGLLTPIDLDTTSNPQPTDIAIDPTGQNLYVVNQGSDLDPNQDGDVTVYEINGTTGELTGVQTGAFAGGSPSSLIFDRTGRFAIATKRSGDSLTVSLVDQLNGQIEPGPVNDQPSEREPTDIALTPDGRFAFAALFDNGNQGRVASYSVDLESQELVATGAITDGANPITLITDPSGQTLYVVNFGSEDVSFFSIDPETGLITTVGSASTGLEPNSIAIREIVE